MKLEREYLSLQHKALNAPGEALAEVRALREELFAVKREKATAQQKEAEVREGAGWLGAGAQDAGALGAGGGGRCRWWVGQEWLLEPR